MDGMGCVFTPVSRWNKTTLTLPPYLSSGGKWRRQKSRTCPSLHPRFPSCGIRTLVGKNRRFGVWNHQSSKIECLRQIYETNTMICSLFSLSHVCYIYEYIYIYLLFIQWTRVLAKPPRYKVWSSRLVSGGGRAACGSIRPGQPVGGGRKPGGNVGRFPKKQPLNMYVKGRGGKNFVESL